MAPYRKYSFATQNPPFFLYCPIIISQNFAGGEVKNELSQKINNTKLFSFFEKSIILTLICFSHTFSGK
jgi:hypothetical protein